MQIREHLCHPCEQSSQDDCEGTGIGMEFTRDFVILMYAIATSSASAGPASLTLSPECRRFLNREPCTLNSDFQFPMPDGRLQARFVQIKFLLEFTSDLASDAALPMQVERGSSFHLDQFA